MDRFIVKCVEKGICAGQSVLTSRELPLAGEPSAHLQDWSAAFNPAPTDEMVAAWLIGFSQPLAKHFKLLQQR